MEVLVFIKDNILDLSTIKLEDDAEPRRRNEYGKVIICESL